MPRTPVTVNMGGISYRVEGEYYYMIWNHHSVILHIPPESSEGIVGSGAGPNEVSISGNFRFVGETVGVDGFGVTGKVEMYEAVPLGPAQLRSRRTPGNEKPASVNNVKKLAVKSASRQAGELASFQEHPPLVLEALKAGKPVWVLLGCCTTSTDHSGYSQVLTYVIQDDDGLCVIEKSKTKVFRVSDSPEDSWAIIQHWTSGGDPSMVATWVFNSLAGGIISPSDKDNYIALFGTTTAVFPMKGGLATPLKMITTITIVLNTTKGIWGQSEETTNHVGGWVTYEGTRLPESTDPTKRNQGQAYLLKQ